MKGKAKLVFDIKVMTENGVIFCAYWQREYEIAAVLASTGTIMNIEEAEQTHRVALKLGWPFKKGFMMPCEACSIGKVKQLVINRHVDNRKKATKAGKRFFLI